MAPNLSQAPTEDDVEDRIPSREIRGDHPPIDFDAATLDARKIDSTSLANVFQLPSPQTPSNLLLAVG
jgi:hypothetical protein